jgi:sugar O-acyltransferase (sialic acid O-acetyltransferase NeuD family)
MMNNIVIFGASGLGKEVLQLLKQINKENNIWNILGFIDDNKNLKNKNINGYAVLGGVEYFETNSSCSVVVAIANPDLKKVLVNKINNFNKGHQFPNIIHPKVDINFKYIQLGIGNLITEGCILTCNIEIGNFNTFNTRTTIGHDVYIEDYNIINPNVQISGNITIGSYNFIAVNSVILQGIKIGNKNHIGACSLVIRNLKNDMRVFGIPAQNIKF